MKVVVWNMEFKKLRLQCGVWIVECAVQKGRLQCGVWSVECEIWNVKCGVWNVKWGVEFSVQSFPYEVCRLHCVV